MPRSKLVRSYPVEFLQLAQAYEIHPTRIILPYKGKAGRQKRLDLYGFKSALREEHMDEVYPNFLAARILLTPQGLCIQAPEQDESLNGIRSVLNELAAGPTAPVKPAPAPIDFTSDHSENAVERFIRGDFDKDKDGA